MLRSLGYVPATAPSSRLTWDEDIDVDSLLPAELRKYRNSMRQRARRAKIRNDPETKEV